jgi:hypothetical protein
MEAESSTARIEYMVLSGVLEFKEVKIHARKVNLHVIYDFFGKP